ncbi:MAG: hypothetical protein M1299_13230 [Firmicutes bacterium]|nr:hypothetical protein [Bacillota bacterium]
MTPMVVTPGQVRRSTAAPVTTLRGMATWLRIANTGIIIVRDSAARRVMTQQERATTFTTTALFRGTI